LNVINVRKTFDESSARQIEVFKRGRAMLGEFGTPLFARAVEPLLIEHGSDQGIELLVQSTVAEDTKDGPNGKKDYGLKLLYVLDLNQNLIAHCLEEAQLVCKPGNHQPITPALGALTVDTW